MDIELRARELFHFLFLERLVRSSAAGLYVLKGGVNLRFFHASPRYSEDMDLDVRRDAVAVGTLRKNGYKILRDPAFRRVLSTGRIADVVVNDPAKAKHTDTTQRFRVQLVLDSGVELPTKVEFSRRSVASGVVSERIDPEIARGHGRTAFVCAHYDAPAAARQKIEALAGRPIPQARDLFDLYLLDSRGYVDNALVQSIARPRVDKALEAVAQITLSEFEGHVLEFLGDEDRARYKGAFRSIQELVFERLSGERT